MKIDEIAKQYFEVKEPLQSKQTFRTNLGFYNNHILPVFSGSGIKTVHYVDYQKFANNLLAKDGKDLKPKTVKNILTVLKLGVWR